LAYGVLTIVPAKADSQDDMSATLTEKALVIPGKICWGNQQLLAEWKAWSGAKTSPGELYLDPQRFAGDLVLRTRRPGDYIQLPAGRKSLKKLMIDDKIPQGERDKLPLLAAGSEIIWVIGRRRSVNCLQSGADYHRILYLRFEERGI
jgi:tRNA(Ile)-lysidine synthase